MYGDVKYGPDTMLVIDRKKKARDLEDVRKHVTQQWETQSVTATDGSTVQLPVKDYPISVCCHSDSPGCLESSRQLNKSWTSSIESIVGGCKVLLESKQPGEDLERRRTDFRKPWLLVVMGDLSRGGIPIKFFIHPFPPPSPPNRRRPR